MLYPVTPAYRQHGKVHDQISIMTADPTWLLSPRKPIN